MRITILALLFSLVAFPLWAAGETTDPNQDEIVYRVNLGRAEDVALLLKGGQAANQTDPSGVPLLALAATRKDKEGLNVMKTLIESGANIDAKDREGQTALFYAAKQGNADAVKYLLENKASYYQTDNRGDIARTIAHRAGHKDIVEMMDGFVTGETQKVNQQYEDLNKTIQKRYQQVEEAEEKAQQQDQTPQEQSPPPAPPVQAPVTPAPASRAASPEIEELSQQLSFHTCAFQYWSYSQAVGQTLELSPDQLDETITEHKEKIAGLSRKLMKKYKVGRKYVDRVTKQSKKHIFNQLAAMPSKTYRFEHGVGKVTDAEERCRDISTRWQEPPPGIPARKAESRDGSQKNPNQRLSDKQKQKQKQKRKHRPRR
jgi:hypothetical protein